MHIRWDGRRGLVLGAVLLLSAVHAEGNEPTFASLPGTTVLDNARVHVERYELAPGQATGRRAHPADQLTVFVRGGLLRAQDGGRTVSWPDGRVHWAAAGEAADGGVTNAGGSPVEMVVVTLKPLTREQAEASRAGWPPAQPLAYPNIPGEDVLENDSVIVQRFIVNPGVWEGVHAHQPNMLYVHIRGGQWAARTYKEAQHLYPAPSPDGGVGWMQTIPLSEGHESGNAGKEPIDLIWITLRH
ncbi:MAG: hypothetical protein JSS29_07080 [Proteobacteria bacterium]|nr:hypothetical protein [Pseudomonadota bacterium]